MKKIIVFISVSMLLFAYHNTQAQCVIDTTNTNLGFSPTSLPCIAKGASYGQTVQLYAPSNLQGVTIYSVDILGLVGLPGGITATINPPSGTIDGGKWGCIWFSGTPSDTDALGSYDLTFSGTAHTSYGDFPLSQPPINGFFNYVVNVCPQVIEQCDTLFNLTSPLDSSEVYALSYPDLGYLSGNNSHGDVAIAEAFTAAMGGHVSGAFLSFGHATINAGDSDNTVKIYLWNSSGTYGTPGARLDSATITLHDIAANVESGALYPQFIYVPFSSLATLPAAIFYVGVELPTIVGDSVALYTSSTNSAHDGRGWEQGSDLSWHSYASYYSGSIGNYISAVACATGSIPSAAFTVTPPSGCVGGTIQLTDMSTYAATNWHWLIPYGNPDTSILQNPQVVYAAPGNYNIKLIAGNFFGADTITNTITVYANPGVNVVNITPASSSSAVDGSVTVAGTLGAGSYSYMWSNQDTGATISNLQTGIYLLTVTDSHGCQIAGDTVLIPFGTNINQLSGNAQIKIYPNPAAEELNMEWSIIPDAEISIIDMNGKTISKYITNGNLLNTFNVRNLSPGAYIIRITDRKTNQQQSTVFNKL